MRIGLAVVLLGMTLVSCSNGGESGGRPEAAVSDSSNCAAIDQPLSKPALNYLIQRGIGPMEYQELLLLCEFSTATTLGEAIREECEGPNASYCGTPDETRRAWAEHAGSPDQVADTGSATTCVDQGVHVIRGEVDCVEAAEVLAILNEGGGEAGASTAEGINVNGWSCFGGRMGAASRCSSPDGEAEIEDASG